MGIACLAFALGAFAPTYWLPLVSGNLEANMAVHLHGLLFFSWLCLFTLQAWLVWHRRLRRHRALGMAGISLATLMVVAAILAGVNRARILSAQGGPAPDPNTFVGAIVWDALLFAVLVLIAVCYGRRADIHGRLMLVATVSILGAAGNRIFRYIGTDLVAYAHAQLAVDLPILLTDLVYLAPLVVDWRFRGSIHPAYLWSIGGVVLLHVVRVPLFESTFTAGLGKLVLGLIG